MSNRSSKSTATGSDAARGAYAARIEKVIRHVEANLDAELTLTELSRIAGFSEFHFHRQFSLYTGITIGRLVRLLRLRRASIQLAFNPDRSVTDIALDAGFENSESFGRAFGRAYGRPPSEFRRSPVWQDWQISQLTENQEPAMNKDVEIVQFPETRVACVEYQGQPDQEYSAVMKLVAWRRENRVGPDQGKTYGLHYTDPETVPAEEYRFDSCVSYDGPIEPNDHGVIEKMIPGGRCARIRHLGSRSHIAEAHYLYRDWLPASGEETRDCPIIFHYLNVGPDVSDADMITDVYLPLR